MKWKFFFGILFFLSIVMICIYASKPLIVYNKTSIEDVPSPSGNSTFQEQINRTYQDNYGSVGGAIAFGTIGAAALIALSITSIKNNKPLS